MGLIKFLVMTENIVNLHNMMRTVLSITKKNNEYRNFINSYNFYSYNNKKIFIQLQNVNTGSLFYVLNKNANP